MFPLEQSTILIVVIKEIDDGVFPMAVTTKKNERVPSTLEVKLTLSSLNILASVPIIE